MDKNKLREKIIEYINKFRWEYIQLGKKREASPDDLIILQGNLADQILLAIPDEEELRGTLDVLRMEVATLSKKLDDREIDMLEARQEGMRTVAEFVEKYCHTEEFEEWQAFKERLGLP